VSKKLSKRDSGVSNSHKKWRNFFVGAINEYDSTFYTDNKNKLFEIGSAIKIFNAILLANLMLEKELSLDERISNYIELNDSIKITFKQLANHTSGLPRLPSNFNQSAF